MAARFATQVLSAHTHPSLASSSNAPCPVGKSATSIGSASSEAAGSSTGLSGGRPPRRYLWTDAFAVCNFLGLERATGEVRHRELALRLVDQVHHTLGRHRPDDVRRGWISGLDEHDGQAHPTRGGPRIGKELPERAPGEAFDEGLEW